MKKLTLLLIWTVFLLSMKDTTAQCEPPVNPTAYINTYDNFGQIEWDSPVHSCADYETDYYEMEIGYFPFNPGLGQGNLITPLYGNFHSLPSMNMMGIQIWVRTVCVCVSESDCCEPGGGGGDAEGEWVMVTIYDITPPCFSGPGAVCSAALTVNLSTAENCGQNFGEELSYCGYVGQFSQSAPNNACSVSSNEGYFEWRKFTAPSSGAVSINVSGVPFILPAWNDFGYRIVEANCNGSLVHCEPAVTSENIVSVEGLTSGTEYYIGVWNNNYNYSAEFTVFNTLTICEATGICIPPSDLSTSDVTDVTVMVHWNANGSELWDLEYGYEGFTPGNGLVIEDVDTNPYLLTGLEPLTTYDVYLKSICEAEVESEQIGPVTFETGIPTFLTDNASIIHSIFPNPTTGQLSIVLNENGPVVVELFGMHGQRVLLENYYNSSFNLNLAHLAKGMYSIRLTTNQQTVTEKVILK